MNEAEISVHDYVRIELTEEGAKVLNSKMPIMWEYIQNGFKRRDPYKDGDVYGDRLSSVIDLF